MSQNEQYDPKVLRKLQLAELEVFKDFIKICDENGLSYFLFAGCAIGVERHKGFIPWNYYKFFHIFSIIVHALNINIFQLLIKWSELQNLRYMILSALYCWHLHIIAKHSLKKYIIILRDFNHYIFKWLFNQWEQVI